MFRSKKILLGLFLALLLVGALGIYALKVSGLGESALEAWIGKEVKSIVNAALIPDLEFDSLDYQGPDTVVLQNVRLVADDPDVPGQRIRIIEAHQLRIVLAQLPKQGEPLSIQSATLIQPTARLVWSQDDGQLIGFSNLTEPGDGGGPASLSGILKIGVIDLQQAAVVFDTREPGVSPAVVDNINVKLTNDTQSDELYQSTVTLDRKPEMTLDAQVTLDLNALTLDFADLAVALDVKRENDGYLPPIVQGFIRDHAVTGQVALQAAGVLNLNAWNESEMDLELSMTGGDAVFGEYRTPIDFFSIKAKTADQVLAIHGINLESLDGWLRGDGHMQLAGDFPMELSLGCRDLEISHLLNATGEDTATRYAGRLKGTATVRAPLNDLLGQMRGHGKLEVRNGRLARLALVSDVIDFMASRGDIRQDADRESRDRDTAEIEFELRGDHAYLENAEIVGDWYAIRGRGKLYFDNQLDIHVNAGPLERVQATLGPIGDAMGLFTDSLVAYRVSGPLKEPEVSLVPLGGLIGAPGQDEGGGDDERDDE